MKPVINSEKRIVQISLSNIAALATAGTNFVDAVQDPSATDPTQVAVGSVVKAVYVELWLLGSGQQPNTSSVIVCKKATGTVSPNFTQMQNLNGWEGKKNIFEMHQGLIGDANTNPSPFFRGWIKIPKGKQRFGLGDKMLFNIAAITEDMQFCGVIIFKVYN